ncbi:unnamed protein product [Moneuplotes crassus]|uniref:Uncharacterized protein n=1 Tax=Euplotes crassus TaxID=5936 RepID=A0AAD1Y487_EUPCR|nr:unnamed protein product [Moneuplotes crassus]
MQPDRGWQEEVRSDCWLTSMTRILRFSVAGSNLRYQFHFRIQPSIYLNFLTCCQHPCTLRFVMCGFTMKNKMGLMSDFFPLNFLIFIACTKSK